MAKKTFNEKLNNAGNLPKVEAITDPRAVARFGGVNMAIAPPIDYNEIMIKIPEGKLITSSEIRQAIAKKYNADYTCQMTAGIFINIVANASRERENEGGKNLVPYWRTLKKDGELNEKYPDGTDGQKLLLESEGHKVIKKGKRCFVENYQDKLYSL
jgi:hypothetical protein